MIHTTSQLSTVVICAANCMEFLKNSFTLITCADAEARVLRQTVRQFTARRTQTLTVTKTLTQNVND